MFGKMRGCLRGCNRQGLPLFPGIGKNGQGGVEFSRAWNAGGCGDRVPLKGFPMFGKTAGEPMPDLPEVGNLNINFSRVWKNRLRPVIFSIQACSRCGLGCLNKKNKKN